MAAKVKIKTLPRILLALAVFASLVLFFRHAVKSGWFGSKDSVPSEVPKQASLPDLPSASASVSAPVAAVPMPGSKQAQTTGPEIRWNLWAWNSQMGLMFANGGPRTTEGSIMQKEGVSVSLVREDDVGKMQASLLAFAKGLQSDPHPKDGVHFVAIMGDGAAAFLAGLQPQLLKLGPEYAAEVVGSCGYSRGEDKFMGLPEWQENPKSARGSLIAGVLRDGDWNIAMKWAGDNGIKNNPDETTWDPDALNWLAADNYIDAGQKYILGACEDRKVVRDGKLTGETKKVCVNGVVTWTPGDVNVAKQKGGLVSIVSTKEYRSQMPNTIIGIRKWNQANAKAVQSMLSGIFQGGDQVRSHPAALTRAAEISAQVYKEEDASYWEKYFRGVTEEDKQGISVPLGGSSVNGLGDNLLLFGVSPGSANIFAATYTVFGDIVVQQYPKLVPSYPKVDDILNVSYIKALSDRAPAASVAVPDRPKFSGGPVKKVVSKRSWSIEFQTGSAVLTPAAEKTMRELANGLLVADELAIEVHGHTDNTGDPAGNMALSGRRAEAVKAWLMRQSATSFPDTRFTVFKHGQSEPAASNSTEDGKSRNRRVVIVLGTSD